MDSKRLYTFSDLFNLTEIQNLQDTFSSATGVASIITKPDGTPITSPSGFSCLCSKIIRGTEKGRANCQYSDSIIGRPCKTGPRIQNCLSAGLIDAGASIMVGDQHIANWMIGQVMDTDANVDNLLNYADEIGADRKEFSEALNTLTRLSQEQFKKISEYLFLNAKLLSNMAVTNIQQKQEIENRILVEQQLFEEKELFKITINSIREGIITTNEQDKITLLNPIAENLTGWTNTKAIGHHLNEILKLTTANTPGTLINPLNTSLNKENEYLLLKSDPLNNLSKNNLFVSLSCSPIKDSLQNTMGSVVVFRDVTFEKKQRERIEYLSLYDSLTNLHNRAFFDQEFKRLQKEHVFPLSIILGDVNGLKIVNDVFGHLKGDEFLKIISNILLTSCNSKAILCRWGGDEFAILLPKTTKTQAQNICTQIHEKCEKYQDFPILPSIALGFESMTSDTQTLHSILESAEEKMYKNKLKQKKSPYLDPVKSLQPLLLEKQGESLAHIQRLIYIGKQLGNKLNLTYEEMKILELAAQFHDIGKVAIPDSILSKPDTLTPLEKEEVFRHSEIGFRIMQSSFEFSHISEIILSHHEHWDGSGYPQGLKGSDIPLLARIITISDSYDLMTHSSLYHPIYTKKQALNEIRALSGKQFDPNLVNLLIQIETT